MINFFIATNNLSVVKDIVNNIISKHNNINLKIINAENELLENINENFDLLFIDMSIFDKYINKFLEVIDKKDVSYSD